MGKEKLVDESKNYICYYCEEEITFSRGVPRRVNYIARDKEAGNAEPPMMYDVYPRNKQWVHVDTGQPSCGTSATPSNIEVEKTNA